MYFIGYAFSFGNNSHHQLGYISVSADANYKPRLVRFPHGSFVKQASAGDLHSLFLLDDGSLFGCGDNSAHQLGLNMTSRFASKLYFARYPPKFVSIIAEFDWSIGISEDGKVFHFGSGVAVPTAVLGIETNEKVVQVVLRKACPFSLLILSHVGNIYRCDLTTRPKPASDSGVGQPSLNFTLVPGGFFFCLLLIHIL